VRPGLFPSSPGQGPNGARTIRIGEGNGAALHVNGPITGKLAGTLSRVFA